MPRILEMPERGTQKEEVEVSHIHHPEKQRKGQKVICYLTFLKIFSQRNSSLGILFLLVFCPNYQLLPNLRPELMG